MAGVERRPHDQSTGIGDARGAGIGDERDAAAGREPLDDVGRCGPLVMLMRSDQWRRNAEPREQRAGDARVFGRDRIDVSKDPPGAQRDVACIADWQRHYIQCTSRQILLGQSRPPDQVVLLVGDCA